MKPTPTQILSDAADMLERLYPGYIDGSGPYNEGIAERDKLIARIRAALSVPAAAVVGEPVPIGRDAKLHSLTVENAQLKASKDYWEKEAKEAREFRAILEGHLSAAIDDYNDALKALRQINSVKPEVSNERFRFFALATADAALRAKAEETRT